MFGFLRHRVAAAAGFCCATAALWAGSGYLPSIGPAPLRFRSAPAAETNWASLPAPILPDQMPVEEEPTNDLPAIAPIPESIVTTAGPSAPATTENQQPSQASTPPANPIVSPQMLIKFFTPGTATNNSVTPQQSVGFRPPPPIAVPTPPIK